MNKDYVIEYLNEDGFKKKERAIKKYNMLTYKKLVFEIYPSLREGNFIGIKISEDEKEAISKYECNLPTDNMFKKIHGQLTLHYTVLENEKVVMLDTLTPEDILTEGAQKELASYKGVMLSKSHSEKDMFKINLLNMISKD